VMFWGVVHPTMAVLPEMKRRGRGRIATITSIGGKVSVPHLLPYCCAKHAAVAFCEGLRAEEAANGIRVTTIAPGLMRTGSYRKAEFKGQHEKEAAWFSLGATLPLVSMNVDRAARQIFRAIERGQSEKILTVQASLLARANGMFPGAIPDLMGMVHRMMPEPTTDRASIATGAFAEDSAGNFFRALTALGRKAAHGLNEMAT
jgi:short-subunit dehydrogenase